jgi:hypothetical protein
VIINICRELPGGNLFINFQVPSTEKYVPYSLGLNQAEKLIPLFDSSPIIRAKVVFGAV